MTLRETIDTHIKTLQDAQKDDILSQVQDLLGGAGLDVSVLSSLLPQPSTGRKARSDAGVKQAPYYRNPDDHSQVAFKRGKKPGWMRELIDSGMKIEVLMIENQK
ncbi:H-NS histone family protein [Candidatus Woesearchaeota archaeon]|nr:H-NS histone family protein [Candidatus Woesearchaeota archaeon]